MAQSLFGYSPEQILQARQAAMQERAASEASRVGGGWAPLFEQARGLSMMGTEALGRGLFPQAQDPMLQRAATTQGIVQQFQGQDFNDPAVLTKMAQAFSQAGIPDVAMQLGEEAKKRAPKVSRTVVAPGSSVVDEQGNVLFTAPDRNKTEQTKVLPPGAVLVDAQGNIIAQGREPRGETQKVSAEWTKYQELLGLGVPQAEARSIAYKTNTLDFRKDLEEARKAEQTQKKEQLVETTVRTIDNVMNTIDTASKQIGTFTAGAIGSPLSLIPGTPAKNLAANLETIKANLGFDRLQQMRDASPTGGALGQVAIQELVALQSSLASLDIQQTPAQLRANLNKIKGHYEKWRSAVNKAKEKGVETIGDRVTAPTTPAQQPSGGVRRYNPATGRVE
jgi:tRNA(Arg) A34 adenosine deaminase TadA